MKLSITEDQRFLRITDSSELELKQTQLSFTKKVANWWIIKKKMEEKGRDPSGWGGEVNFIDRYYRIPIGLWVELINLGKKYHFPVKIENSDILTDKKFDVEDFNDWVAEYFDGAATESGKEFYPYEFQFESARKALKYRFCTEEISTSGGKTLISFMIFRYLLDRKKIEKLLYIVPSVDLVTQTYDAFLEYDEYCGHPYEEMKWKGEMVFGKARKTTGNKQITFGTYQSLNNKDLNYFKDFDAIIADECLHPDTLITMSNFSKKKIKDIKKGEKVWTRNTKSGKLEIKEVDYVFKNLSKNQQMYEVEMENGNIIKITGNHKVYTSNHEWKRIDDITAGEEIISFDSVDI